MSDEGKRKGRSPSYPAIDLEQAVERARALLKREDRHLVPVDTALEAWGYSQGSGAGLVVVAALKKFGLLDDEGTGADRRVRLTDMAYEILIDEREDSPERRELLRQAALGPRIHVELWNRFGTRLPSDSTLRYELRKLNFTDDATRKLIAEWRKTLEYAELTERDAQGHPIVVGEDSSAPEPEQAPAESFSLASSGGLSTTPSVAAPQPQQTSGQTVQLPLSQGRWAMLSAPFPLDEGEWTQMLGILQAMKPALTSSPSITTGED